jgi:hypothetical protein
VKALRGLYVHPRNWHLYTHYKTGPQRDTWIKVDARLHYDDAILSLTGHQRAVLLGIWCEYMVENGRLPADTLSGRLNLWVRVRDLQALEQTGLIALTTSEHEEMLDYVDSTGVLDDVDTGAHTRDGGLRRRRIPRPHARGPRSR